MSGTAKISTQQLACTVGIFEASAQLLYLAGPMAAAAGPDAWLAVLLGIGIGALPSVLLLHLLLRYHPGRGLTEIAHITLGKWVGKVVALVLAAFSLFICSLVIRDVMDFSAVAVLPGTPLLAVAVLFTAVVVYAAYCGAEVIARLAVLTMLAVIFFTAAIPLGLLRELSLPRILPVLGTGIGGIYRGAWVTFGWFAEVWVFGELLGLLDQPQRAFRSLVWGTVLGGLVLEIITLFTLLVFGSDLTQVLVFPSFGLVQQVSVGEFVERVEVVLIGAWIVSMMVKSGVLLWTASVATAALFGLKSDKKLILPLSAGAVALTYIWHGIMPLISFSVTYPTPVTWSLATVLPALLLVVSWWRARRKKGSRTC